MFRDREKSKKLKAIFEKVVTKRGGRFTGSDFFGLPSYEFIHSDAQVIVMKEFSGWGFPRVDVIDIMMESKAPLGCNLAITGKEPHAFKKATDFISKLLMSKTPIEITGLSSNGLKIIGDDVTLIKRILSDEIKEKLVKVNQKFSLFQLGISEDAILFCQIWGIPETAGDFELLMETVLSIYDSIRKLCIPVKDKVKTEDSHRRSIVNKFLKTSAPLVLMSAVVSCSYVVVGLISGLFFITQYVSFFQKNDFSHSLAAFFCAILSFGGAVGGIGALFFKKWGIKLTNCLLVLLFCLIIMDRFSTGFIQELLRMPYSPWNFIFSCIIIAIFLFFGSVLFFGDNSRIRNLFD